MRHGNSNHVLRDAGEEPLMWTHFNVVITSAQFCSTVETIHTSSPLGDANAVQLQEGDDNASLDRGIADLQ